MREFKFRFWGIFDGDEKPKMVYGDDFAFYDYAPKSKAPEVRRLIGNTTKTQSYYDLQK
jgi:hypothetical protein